MYMHNTSSLSLFFHLWALSAVQQSRLQSEKCSLIYLFFTSFRRQNSSGARKKVYIVQRSRKKGGRKRGIISHLEKLNNCDRLFTQISVCILQGSSAADISTTYLSVLYIYIYMLYAPFFFHSPFFLLYSPGLKQHVYTKRNLYAFIESQQSHSSSTELK